jgi:hypothetical protein
MTPALFRHAGEALFASRWQSEMARALGVSDRTVRRWAAGAAVPAGARGKLTVLLAERKIAIDGLLADLPIEARE